LDKWLGVHIAPRLVAIGVHTATRFCCTHLASDEALEHLNKARSLDSFLAAAKEVFFQQMISHMCFVVPDADTSKAVLTPPYVAPELQDVRKSRQVFRRLLPLSFPFF